jgi:predicted ATP-grasp superfamily ATP-dependent carboligase
MGLSPTGLYAVRELGCAGMNVLGIDDEFACGQFSRFLSHPDRYWRIQTEDDLLARLIELAETSESTPILIPTSDRFIYFIARFHYELKSRFLFQESYTLDMIDSIVNKGRFYSLCHQHGLDVPRLWQTHSKDEMRVFSDKVDFPCILKPELIHEMKHVLKGKKVLFARNRKELDKHINNIPEKSGAWLMQEVIPGPESNIYLFGGYFDKKGAPIQTFTGRKLRQYPPGFGSASLAISEENTQIHDLSIQFLKAIRFKGICGTEFKLDPRDGKMKIMEINPRPTLWFNLARSAGKRIVETAYFDLTGQNIPEDVPQTDGVIWRYVLKDMYSKSFYKRKGSEFILPSPVIDKNYSMRSWAVFDRKDPIPFFMEPMQYLKKALKRI